MGVASTLESILSPAIAPDELRSYPSGVAKKYVDAELVNTQALEHADRNDQITSDELRRPVGSVVPTGQTDWAQTAPQNLESQAREGPCRSSKT